MLSKKKNAPKVQGVWTHGKWWIETGWKIRNKEFWINDMWMDQLESSRYVKIFIVSVCPPENIYHRRDTKQPSGQNYLASWCQPASLICYRSVGTMDTWTEKPLWQRWRLQMGLTHQFLLTKIDLSTTTANYPAYQQQRPMLSTQMSTIP